MSAARPGLVGELRRRYLATALPPAPVPYEAVVLDALWPAGNRAGVRTVDVHGARIRAKLGSANPIRTIRGVGYVADQGRNGFRSAR